MRSRVPVVVFLLALGACGGDDDIPAATATTATIVTEASGAVELSAEELCDAAASTLGAADPPTDLTGVATGAQAIAERAGDPAVGDLDPPLADALDGVRAGAELLEDAAASGDSAAITDAAATLTSAYDELDLVAADLRTAACSSESWGRQVVIVAVDLTGAGG